MDTSLTWLYECQDKFRKRTGRALWSISDWHNEPNDVVLPTSLLASVKLDPLALMRYRFVDSMLETKMRISSFYRDEFRVSFDQSDLAFCQNGTSALSLVIKALAETGVRRVLIVTPAYFSLFSVPVLYGISVVFHHTDLLDPTSIYPDRILSTAQDQMVDAIFLTNPVFSTGRNMPAKDIQSLACAAENNGIWLVLDETFAGLSWTLDPQRPFATANMLFATQRQRFVYLWSVSKALFLNGAKHALVLAPPEIVRKIEMGADQAIGGLTAHQIAVAEQIYSTEGMREAANCCSENIERFSATYDLCNACLDGTSLQLTSSNAGIHGIVFSMQPVANSAIRAREISAKLIERHGVSSIPTAHFGFSKFSPIGFRVNYSKNPGKIQVALALLAEIFDEDSNFAH